tara:strand:- start:279 stop:767 length:489 start_codon:yes stop_codon:yes gene_type:complete
MKLLDRKSNINTFLVFIILIFSSNSTSSNSESKKNFFLHGGYTFESFPGQKTAAVYVSAFNYTNQDILIESISTDIALISEIHDIKKDGNIMKMFKVKNLKIKANDSFFFRPGATHIMLKKLQKELEDGQEFEIKFHLNNSKTVGINIKVLKSSLRSLNNGI